MAQLNATPEGQYGSTTHYIACSIQDNRPIPCFHMHKTIADAVACIEGVDGSVKAFTDGQERSLTTAELNKVVTELLVLLHDQKELARRDHLTRALNRRAFEEILFKEILGYQSKLSRRRRSPFTFAYVDLDGFKAVNDSRGHPVGDSVLKAVVQSMHGIVRASDTVARLGGDEFALLMPETDAEGARVLIAKFKEALSTTMHTYQWDVTFSMGVVTFKSPPPTPDCVIDMAERQMRFAKSQGKNRVSYLNPD